MKGEPADILRRAGAVVVEPESADQLADAVRALAADPERRTAMGAKGRAFVAEHYDRAKLARMYRGVIAE